MALSQLPTEVLLSISEILPSPADLNRLSRVNFRLQAVLEDQLYRNELREHGNRSLIWAARRGEVGTARKLIRNGADVNRFQGCIRPALSYAAWWGQVGFIQFLIQETDVLLDQRDSDGYTALSLAAANAQIDAMRLLLDSNRVRPDWPNNACNSPLLFAARAGHLGAVETLLGRGQWNSDAHLRVIHIALCAAIQYDHTDVVKRLLLAKDVAPLPQKLFRDESGWVCAARYGHKHLVQIILEHYNAKPHTRKDFNENALLIAAKRGNNFVLQLLVERFGTHPDSRAAGGATPLSTAVEHGREMIVKFLLADDRVSAIAKGEAG